LDHRGLLYCYGGDHFYFITFELVLRVLVRPLLGLGGNLFGMEAEVIIIAEGNEF
jgi:hypothetical protein